MAAKVTVYKCPDGTDFPVEWQEEADEQYGWFWDQMHCPLPITPLSRGFWGDIMAGFRGGMEITGSPVRPVSREFHGFTFTHPEPARGDVALQFGLASRDVALRGERLLDLWRDEYQPECQALTRSIRALAEDAKSLPWPEILDQVHASRRRLGQLHMLAMGLTTPAASMFIDTCKQEFGPEGELIATDLMGGFHNKSMESAIGLWELAEAAKGAPAVEKLLRDNRPSEFLAALASVEGGAAFRERLDAYLEVYGHRNESFSELSFPTWREEPRFALLMIRRYIDSPADASPGAMHQRVERRRETRLAEVLPKLSADPEKRDAFLKQMRGGQVRTVLLEDHNFYIDQRSPSATREVCSAIGEVLAARGIIGQRDDVYYLGEEDIRRAAAGDDYRTLVAANRAERDRWMRVLPPASIGAGAVMMPEPMQRFFGPTANEPMEAGAFRGVAGSPGQVRGIARLILTLDDIDNLAPGEILVTYATAPPWTPAFAIAGGIVTDTGGMLSHCAVVAREYGIPAVVGSRVATATIQDGQLITVDGTAGVVRLEE